MYSPLQHGLLDAGKLASSVKHQNIQISHISHHQLVLFSLFSSLIASLFAPLIASLLTPLIASLAQQIVYPSRHHFMYCIVHEHIEFTLDRIISSVVNSPGPFDELTAKI